MERYFKKKPSSESSIVELSQQTNDGENEQKSSNKGHIEVNLDNLPRDPSLRPNIMEYPSNVRDEVRRAYLQKGPCQPCNHIFPKRQFGSEKRRFIVSWFKEYGSWLEYSIESDSAFCLCCYLFKLEHGGQAGGDSFVSEGFSNWRKKERFDIHVGGLGSIHNTCLKDCEALMNQKQHIQVALSKQSDQARNEYRTRLTASVDCIRFLLRQGLAFHGHDESEHSKNHENFLELLQFLSDHNVEINKVALKNAPENLKMIAPKIQKDFANASAIETTNAIMREVEDELLSILVDDSRDISIKEQMAVVIRFVNKKGCVIERFLGIVHVADTTAISLKAAIESLFSKHGLSISSLRGQGYDGASNMQGEFNGLKSLIMRENKSTYFVHCFSHQLQLTLVAVAKKHIKVGSFFNLVTSLVNIVRASCKRRDILREKEFAKLIEGLRNGDVMTGRGLNQETMLKRPGDTRWGSHYGTLISVICMFPSVINVLDVVVQDGTNSEQRLEANDLLDAVQCFEFVFILHLMKSILGITNELSQALQRKDQDIVNAMTLVKVSKQRLQLMRDGGWESTLDEVSSFCKVHDITISSMEERFVVRGQSRRNVQETTNLHHYRVELFYMVIDMQLQELNNRFNETNTELLLCLACLDPSNSFLAFNNQKLIHLAHLYPFEFLPRELIALHSQLQNYITDMRDNDNFSEVIGIGGLAKKLVELKKDDVYPLVYLLVKLALILLVATATVERAFSAMKIIKAPLRNRMGDDWMNVCLVTYIERDVFDTIDNETIIQRFQNMKSRRGVL